MEPKPLGRGLEQVSRVFLSEAATQRPPPPDEPDAASFVVRHAARVTRQHIDEAVRDHAEAIEEGLRILDRGIPCAPCGEIDFLAVDRKNQLAVIDVETAPADELLIRGLSHFDWIVGNVANLRRMYRGQPINLSLQPRILLLAPQFSTRVRSAARPIASPEIEWIRYHVVEARGQTGVLFERLPALD